MNYLDAIVYKGDGQIVDVSSSFGYFKKLEVNLVDDLNCETTASADQICTNRDKGVSGKSTNTEKMDEEGKTRIFIMQ